MSVRIGSLRRMVTAGVAGVLSALVVLADAAAASSAPAPRANESGDYADWAVDPTVPGDNVPAMGRSLFDHLVARKNGNRMVHDVPFPFTALLARLQRELPREGGGAGPVKAVLIPQGRSLQRAAGEPRPYALPRVVLVPDAEPRPQAGEGGKLLKDRLYLGYHETAEIIEIISYNEAAGRFEFQVVKDYRPGGRPKVYYANRAICTSCHQNAAPIFSRQLWDETNGNAAIAARLLREKRAYYGIAPDRGVDVPYAIDNATDRANLYSAYQLLWRAGCGAAEDREQAIRCRAGLLTAALQYRLSGKQQYDRASLERAGAMAAFKRGASVLWPAGLRIANPDLPNRNPRGVPPFVDEGRAEVRPAFDPLTPREPLEVWQVAAPATLDRLVAGLADFIAEADVRRLDAHLQARASQAPRTVVSGTCSVSRGVASGRERVDFECTPPAGATPGVAAAGRFYVAGARIPEGAIERLASGGGAAAYPLRDLDITAGGVKRGSPESTAELRVARAGTRVRSAEGHAIAAVALSWKASPPGTPASGELRVTVVDDFAPVREAIEAMTNEARAGTSDALTDRPFRRVGLLRPLFETLRMPAIAWCCEDDAGMPPAVMEAEPKRNAAHAVELEPFYRYCATCHQSPERSPPNFLEGTPKDVADKIAHCAPRLHVRLSMWQHAPAERTKTPMPPRYALASLHIAPESWREGRDLAALRAYVEQLLKKESGKAPPAAELLGQGYENLRECLP